MNLIPIPSGASAYVYTAYASDASGTDFTTIFDAALDYIAFKVVMNNPITPVVGDFAGLWKNYKGVAGAAGATGATGATGSTGATGDPGPTGPAPVGHTPMTAEGMYPALTAPCDESAQYETTTHKVNYWAMNFPAGSKTHGCGSTALPADWDAGTLTAKIEWLADDATTNSVIFGLALICSPDGTAADVAWGTPVEVTDNNGGVANQVRTTIATAAITAGGTPQAGAGLSVDIYRDGVNDTLAVGAKIRKIIFTFTRA